MMKMLGVDYGEARTGLAVSDDTGLFAFGIGTIKSHNIEATAREVARKAEECRAELIVIGHPINMNGTLGEKSGLVHRFGEILATFTAVPYTFFDERCTTMVAHKFLSATDVRGAKRKNVIDSLSAEIILQDYMDYRKNLK